MPTASISRRDLFKTTAAGAGAAAATQFFPSTSSAAMANAPDLSKGDVVLFQGDSITDVGRDRNAEGSANNLSAMGRGYPLLIASALRVDHRDADLQIYNRGISGNKVPDLQNRWQKDCLDLKPAVLSILIGVNDIWHKMNGHSDGTVESYRTGYAALLKQTRAALPDTTLVVCEPFALRCGAVKDDWFPEFDERRAVAKDVATEAGAVWVPFQTMFDEAVDAGTKPEYWAADGVHPTLAGHELMARTWRETVGI